MCTTNLRHFPSIIPDNDSVYIQYLMGIINSVDELSCLEITKAPFAYHFRLAPSTPRYSEILLKEILNLHNFFKIHLDLSKSIKTSGTITFSINLEN